MKAMLVILVLVMVGGLAYYLLKNQGAFGAQVALDTVVETKKPFWQKLLIAGTEQYRNNPFDAGEFIRDVTSL